VQDDRETLAELAVQEAELAAAMAAVKEAEASLHDAATQYALVRGVTDSRAVSTDDREKRKNAEQLAKAKLLSAQAAVTTAKAGRDATVTTLDRLTVRAPISGKVLQVNVRPGEYAATGELATPLVRLGDVTRFQVRTDIDENDAWRFSPGTRAVAYVRGNRELAANMRFLWVEPYVVSKTQLSGASTERVDTRVLQVLFELDPADLPVYVGQQLDVFIEAPQGAASGVGLPAAPGTSKDTSQAPDEPHGAAPGVNLFAQAAKADVQPDVQAEIRACFLADGDVGPGAGK
jgi:multidrug efflux pump subunit AcrA (membrane-fusion protein)